MHPAFKTNHLTYLSLTLTISKKKKENISNLKNFCKFRGFALHYKSVESAENWQDLVLILGNRLDYILSELKLMSNLRNYQKIESWQLFDWKIITEVTSYNNWWRLPCSCCNVPQILENNYLTYWSSTFKISKKKNEKLSKIKNFSQIDGKLRKLRIISKWKTGLSILRVETEFAACEIN